MPPPPAHAVRCLKEAGAHSVWLIERPGQAPVTLKTWRLTVARALKLLIGLAQPQLQVRGTRRLQRLGVRTPALLGGWKLTSRRGSPLLTVELRYVPGHSALDLLDNGKIEPCAGRSCARQIGRAVRILAENGYFHRDFKLNNVVIDDSDEPAIWVVDTVGVRRISDRLAAIMRMLDRLFLQAASRPAARPPRLWGPLLREALAGLAAADRRNAIRQLRKRFAWGCHVP